MKVLVTGAGGFLGTRLTRALLARGRLTGPDGEPRPIDELVLVDRVAPDAPEQPTGRAIRIRALSADASDPATIESLVADGPDSVFAMAATLTVESETDFARGLDVNLRGLLALLEALRLRGNAPRFVFTSSLAAFGGPLPESVDDAVQLTPQTSYGTQKAIGELLVADYSRHGFVDGRCLRLPIVMTRHPGAGAPPAAATTPTVSGAIAAIVGDRLLGRDVSCPLAPDTRIAAASAERVIDALVAIHELPAASFGHTRSMNLPSLSLTLAELAEASGRAAERAGVRAGAMRWAPDPRFQAAVDQWPKRFVSARASQAGIGADRSADEIVAAYLRDNPRALA
ncbi:NAD-dependent epimerase/dehydratase family protein [Burkholderiaceae bacterium FT117]|uniref:NAD-dependent epimerase/dehydratase family protein n=1 Tax=Zeimonas sediminis TaxID=2944268 RepID=UPI002342DA25|nr:NAD-dependent epimerase/dehydratase family protein [Zeimonas sediminis]MCM5569574.1 NAD-dependent epimerase/dehydratase family protein [Zeimonas sediminis]